MMFWLKVDDICGTGDTIKVLNLDQKYRSLSKFMTLTDCKTYSVSSFFDELLKIFGSIRDRNLFYTGLPVTDVKSEFLIWLFLLPLRFINP